MTLAESLQPGMPAPDFTLPDDTGAEVTLSSLRGRKVILYFYPKDNTSGCTLEAQNFRDRLADFEKLGYAIYGLSRDGVKTHCNFRAKHGLTFPLLSDREETVVKLYDVLKEKTMYGKKCFGIERSTFVIDENGILTHVLRKVNAKTHVDELHALLAG